jgi:uncharacterized membrane protein YeaQ/YmgE (transglycosylase-associated protein family)
MSLIVWIVLGFIAGFLVNQILPRESEGPALNIVLGIAGAVASGLLFNLAGGIRAGGLGFWNVFASAIGAVVVLGIKHAVQRRWQVRT